MSESWTVVLVRPETPENVGLSARAMKNTGFHKLRLVGASGLDDRAFMTAVHAEDILREAEFFPGLVEATADLDVLFAATARSRKNYSSLSLSEAVTRMQGYGPRTKVGLLFGNERTGLTTEEMRHSNFRFTIPQAYKQPSYNLASAVLLTLFQVRQARGAARSRSLDRPRPLPREQQEACLNLILKKLEARGFIHETNRVHMTDRMFDLFGRLEMTDEDRRLLLALFGKGLEH